MLSVCNLPSAALLAVVLTLPNSLSAQTAPEDAGAFQAGWTAADFYDTVYGRGHVRGRIYYPAHSNNENALPDSGSGPYPLIALNHGWLGTPNNYHELSQHLASWGFIVSSIGTETSFFGNMVREAADSHALMAWVETESQNPSSAFFGMVDSNKLGAIGHSMGGGSMAYMIGLDARIQTVVPMEAFMDGLGFDNEAIYNLRAYTGSILFLAGRIDEIAPPGDNSKELYDHCIRAHRRHFVLLQGAGHGGPTDSPSSSEPMSAAEQQRFHRRYVGAYLRAELYGEEELYGDMFGYGAINQPLLHESIARAPAFWATPEAANPGTISVGMTALPNENGIMVWSLTPANRPTSYGILGLDPRTATVLMRNQIGPDGVMEVEELIPIQWNLQTVYFQGITSHETGARLTRTVAVDLL